MRSASSRVKDPTKAVTRPRVGRDQRSGPRHRERLDDHEDGGAVPVERRGPPQAGHEATQAGEPARQEPGAERQAPEPEEEERCPEEGEWPPPPGREGEGDEQPRRQRRQGDPAAAMADGP